MEQFILKMKSNFLSKEFIKFIGIGVINTINSTILAKVYGLVLAANIAFVAGYISNLYIAYILNSKFIFYKKSDLIGFIKFAVSYIPNFIIQNVIVLITYNLLHLPDIVAYLAAAIIGVPITFLCVKLFVFGKK